MVCGEGSVPVGRGSGSSECVCVCGVLERLERLRGRTRGDEDEEDAVMEECELGKRGM